MLIDLNYHLSFSDDVLKCIIIHCLSTLHDLVTCSHLIWSVYSLRSLQLGRRAAFVWTVRLRCTGKISWLIKIYFFHLYVNAVFSGAENIWNYSELLVGGMTGWFNWSLLCLILKTSWIHMKIQIRKYEKIYFSLLSFVSFILFSQGHKKILIMVTKDRCFNQDLKGRVKVKKRLNLSFSLFPHLYFSLLQTYILYSL